MSKVKIHFDLRRSPGGSEFGDVGIVPGAFEVLPDGCWLKKPIEWSLKTWMAPWSYLASVTYHDLYWYPKNGNNRVHKVLQSDWGRLFHNWENVEGDENGFQAFGEPPKNVIHSTKELLKMGMGILGTAAREAPEVAARRRRRESK